MLLHTGAGGSGSSEETMETNNVSGGSNDSNREKRKANVRPAAFKDGPVQSNDPVQNKKERNRWEAGEGARASSIFLDRNNLEPAKELLEAVVRDPQLVFDADLKFVKNFLLHFGVDFEGQCNHDAPIFDDVEVQSQRLLHGDEDECEEDDYLEEGIDEKLLPPENDPMPAAGRDSDLEPSDQDFERAAEHRVRARQASDACDWSLATDELTAALQLAPSSLLYAQRATVLLSALRPLAALRDCDFALAMNPDSAKTLKTRGAVHRHLGDWQAAHADLSTGLSIDYDDESAELFKACAERHERAMARRREREERQAQRSCHSSQTSTDFKDDPDMVRAASNPKVIEAVQAISKNPNLATQYLTDPDIAPVVLKLFGHMAAKEAHSTRP